MQRSQASQCSHHKYFLIGQTARCRGSHPRSQPAFASHCGGRHVPSQPSRRTPRLVQLGRCGHKLFQSRRNSAQGRQRRIGCTSSQSEDALVFQESSSRLWKWRGLQARRILQFAGPALSIPLADPLMSTIDAICIGQVMHRTRQQSKQSFHACFHLCRC